MGAGRGNRGQVRKLEPLTIFCDIGGVRLVALIDTGAASTLCSQRAADKLLTAAPQHSKYLADFSQKFTLADNSVVPSGGRVEAWATWSANPTTPSLCNHHCAAKFWCTTVCTWVWVPIVESTFATFETAVLMHSFFRPQWNYFFPLWIRLEIFWNYIALIAVGA